MTNPAKYNMNNCRLDAASTVKSKNSKSHVMTCQARASFWGSSGREGPTSKAHWAFSNILNCVRSSSGPGDFDEKGTDRQLSNPRKPTTTTQTSFSPTHTSVKMENERGELVDL